MKKQGFAFLALLVGISMAFPLAAARADGIALPPRNEFYEEVRSHCTAVNEDFRVGGEGDSVPVRREPGSDSVMTTVAKGATIRISATYDLNGETWGLTQFASQVDGWILMDQLRPTGEQSDPAGLPIPTLIIIIVAALIVVTAVLIMVFWKRGRLVKRDGPG